MTLYEADSYDKHRWGPEQTESVVTAAGSYRIHGIPPGKYVLHISYRMALPGQEGARIITRECHAITIQRPGTTLRYDVSLFDHLPVSVSGTVTIDGRPVPRGSVRFSTESRGRRSGVGIPGGDMMWPIGEASRFSAYVLPGMYYPIVSMPQEGDSDLAPV